VLYRYETWALILREKHLWTVLENKASTRIFESKKEKVTGS